MMGCDLPNIVGPQHLNSRLPGTCHSMHIPHIHTCKISYKMHVVKCVKIGNGAHKKIYITESQA